MSTLSLCVSTRWTIKVTNLIGNSPLTSFLFMVHSVLFSRWLHYESLFQECLPEAHGSLNGMMKVIEERNAGKEAENEITYRYFHPDTCLSWNLISRNCFWMIQCWCLHGHCCLVNNCNWIIETLENKPKRATVACVWKWQTKEQKHVKMLRMLKNVKEC